MKLKPELVELHAQMIAWRQDIHAHPETAFEEKRTAEIVARHLSSLGMEVHRGLATTGVVGVLSSGTSNRCIGLRADMDALDLDELNTFSYRSVYRGKMHACGHDGHTAMLLGAATYLSKFGKFNGKIVFIFQPAEENRAGAKVMIDEGLFRKFPVSAVYGMHNVPRLNPGEFAVHKGPAMAAADFFEISIFGLGTHAAHPHSGVDPVVVGAEIVTSLQNIVSRNCDPLESAVVSVTQFHSGTTTNVIPDTAVLSGTTRSLNPVVQKKIKESLYRISQGVAAAHGARVEITYESRYCPTINSPDHAEIAARAAAEVVGQECVHRDLPPSMGAEDFGWMLQEVPGCYVWIGNGQSATRAAIHNPRYDFNDEILPIGASYWAALAESELPQT